ncbi:MAG: 16S rRNA (cytosine(967)-C(5))-methyltransferase RsmB [Oscillospiraceae bacterium]|nr:16S rRNA (cytosine(967)-C(5))-methyltransferase RsmB [Oscillospiraceae bacterium]
MNELHARSAALKALLRVEKDGAYVNLVLDSCLGGLSRQDCAFVSALVYGVCERQITLDFLLEQKLRGGTRSLRPTVLCALRMGAYQLLYMNAVPQSAAVNTTVQLLKNNKCAYAAGLANAVLRKITAEGLTALEKADMAVRYSVPQWLVELWVNSYGEEMAAAILEASFDAGQTYIRVNTGRTTAYELARKLKARQCEELPGALILPKGTVPQKTREFADGLFHVQGKASQNCVAALAPKAGERILDLCAAPGGKTFTMAQDAREVAACELHPQRANLIEEGARRLGLENINVLCADGTALDPKEIGFFDAVLCDVPCSGLGTIAKRPDIRKKLAKTLDNLPKIQYTLLSNASSFVVGDGRLVYSTCTLNLEENEKVVGRFLEENSGFELVSQQTLFPHIHGCDGFFIALLKRL